MSDAIAYSYQVVAYARTVVDGEIGYMASDPSNTVDVKYVSTSIDGVEETADAPKVYVENGGIVVDLVADSVISVYNVSGQEIVSVSGRQGANHISVKPGLAIVKVGGKSVKVLVR